METNNMQSVIKAPLLDDLMNQLENNLSTLTSDIGAIENKLVKIHLSGKLENVNAPKVESVPSTFTEMLIFNIKRLNDINNRIYTINDKLSELI